MLLLSVCESNFNTFLKLICDITQNIRVNTDCPKWKKKHTDQVLITMNRFCYWSVQCFCLKRSHYICWQWLYEGKNFSFFSLLWKKTNKNQSCHFWHKQWYQLICTWFNIKEHLTYFQLTFHHVYTAVSLESHDICTWNVRKGQTNSMTECSNAVTTLGFYLQLRHSCSKHETMIIDHYMQINKQKEIK